MHVRYDHIEVMRVTLIGRRNDRAMLGFDAAGIQELVKQPSGRDIAFDPAWRAFIRRVFANTRFAAADYAEILPAAEPPADIHVKVCLLAQFQGVLHIDRQAGVALLAADLLRPQVGERHFRRNAVRVTSHQRKNAALKIRLGPNEPRLIYQESSPMFMMPIWPEAQRGSRR